MTQINNEILNLKNKIENEIKQIDNLYEKINNEVVKSYELKHENLRNEEKQIIKNFELKHEQLTKEENDLIEELQNKTTNVKEKLEIALSESNNYIKKGERIDKGIKLLIKEKGEDNMIKVLSYISKLNKVKKEMEMIFKKLIKNLKISFNEEKKCIQYEDYYFNGIQTPKDIEIKEVKSDNFKVCWKIDDINIVDLDNSKIKFRVEIRKENENEKFNKVYEDYHNYCFIDNLNSETNYEIRICCIYNSLISPWSQIQKIKKKIFYDFNCDSIILKESNRKNEFLEKIFDWCGYGKMELIYRGSRDGSSSKVFHTKCDNQGPTICLFQNEKNYIFGGYSSTPWTINEENGWKKSKDNFIFTLTNIFSTIPTKFPVNNFIFSTYNDSEYGPYFGYTDILIYKDYKNFDCQSNFTSSYTDTLGKGKSIFTGDFNNENNKFKIKEMEVFKLLEK